MPRPGPKFVACLFVLALAAVGPTSAQEQPAGKDTTKTARRQAPLFSAGARVGKTLYISGKGDYRPDAAFPEKVENCLSEIRKTLQSAGLDMRHVVKSFVYLEDHDRYADLNPHYAKFFPDDPPARTTLGVAQVPGESRLEITCIAYTDLAERKRIGDVAKGLPFSPGILAGRHALRLGQGRPATGRGPSVDVRGAGAPVIEERRDDAQAGRARLPPCRDEPRLPR